MRTGVFLPNWIGDVAMATPALRSLRMQANERGDQLIGLMRPYVAEVLDGIDWFDESRLLKKNNKRRATAPSPARVLRDAKLDRVILLTNSFRTAWLAWRSGARERIGVSRDFRGPLLTTKVFEPRRNWRRVEAPPIDSYLTTAYAAGGPWRPPTLELGTTGCDERGADEIWERFNLPPGDRVVVLNSGGARGAAKSWPAEYFGELAQRSGPGRTGQISTGPADSVDQ